MNASGLERFSRLVVVDSLRNFAFASLPETLQPCALSPLTNSAIMMQWFASTASHFLMQFHPIMLPLKSPKWFCWSVLWDNMLCYYSYFKSLDKQTEIKTLSKFIWGLLFVKAGRNALMDVRSREGWLLVQMVWWIRCSRCLTDPHAMTTLY